MKRLACLLIMVVLINITTGVVEAKAYKDVSSSDWFYNNVMKLSDLNVIDGFPNGEFRPQQNINVDAFIKMTVTALGYTDIKNGLFYWAQPYIDKAKDLGLVNDGEFSSYTRPIYRNEMARIIIRALDEEYPDNLQDYKSLITDYDTIYSSYQEYVLKAYCKGILTGYADGSFRGENTATRAEAATIIYRLIDPAARKVPELPEVERVVSVFDYLVASGDYVRVDDNLDWLYTHKTKGKSDLAEYNFRIARVPEDKSIIDLEIIIYYPSKEVRELVKDILKLAYPEHYETVYKYFILTLRGEIWEMTDWPGIDFNTPIGDRMFHAKNCKLLDYNDTIQIFIYDLNYHNDNYSREYHARGVKPLEHIRRLIKEYEIYEYTIEDFFKEYPDYIGPYYGENKDDYIGSPFFTLDGHWRNYGEDFLRKQLWIE